MTEYIKIYYDYAIKCKFVDSTIRIITTDKEFESPEDAENWADINDNFKKFIINSIDDKKPKYFIIRLLKWGQTADGIRDHICHAYIG